MCILLQGIISVRLDHHVYDNLSETWVRRSSKPQPFINVTIQTHSQDYVELDFGNMYVRSSSVSVPPMADTGCQSCLAGLKVLVYMKLT